MIFENNDNIPLTNIPGTYNIILFFGISVLLSILFVILFPKYIAPLFLKMKGKSQKNYDNAYIKLNSRFSFHKYLKRCLNCILLLFGLLSFIIPLVKDYTIDLWLSENLSGSIEEEGLIAEYTMDVFMPHMAILIPIVVGIWSVSWILEDLGLMHFRLGNNSEDHLYEIEPIHIKYSSYVKGYAGISSLLFFFEVIFAYSELISHNPGRIIDMMMIILVPFISIILMLPAYIFYQKKKKSFGFLTKNLRELKQLQKEDILI